MSSAKNLIKKILRLTVGATFYERLAVLYYNPGRDLTILRRHWRELKLWLKGDFSRRLKREERFWAEAWMPEKQSHRHLGKRAMVSEIPASMAQSKARKYIWASIVRGENHGNYLIEYCLKRILQLPKPSLVVNVLQEEFPSRVDDYRFIINPGTTTLYQHPNPDVAFRKFVPGKIPAVCFGASAWYMDRWSEFVDEEKLIQVAKKMQYPIGCRDPFTYELLRHNDIKAEFIGCPTLFFEVDAVPGDHVAFSFGRDNIPEQIRLLRHLSERENVRVLIHEVGEETYCRNLQVEIIKDLPEFLRIYHSAKYIITGRLHGALPGISARRPVFYFRGVPEFDSRLTLLSYLRLPIQTINKMYTVDTSALQYDFKKVMHLKESFSSYVKKFREDFDL